MTMFKKAVKTFQWGNHQVIMETGEIARQSGGAVIVNVDDTVVMGTVVASKSAKPGQSFFPLTVDYLEKTYAAGKIPGGFFRREGRPSEGETLISRLIDRPLRPLFPEGFLNEVQVVIHVLSINPDVPSDIPALIAASAALAISGIPFAGPVGAARVGYANGQYLLNPTRTEQATSEMDLIVAGTQAAVLMVESEANQLSEEVMLGAVVYGHDQMQTAINAINELVTEAGKPEWDWTAAPKDEPFIAKVTALAEAPLREAYQIRQKGARSDKLKEITKTVMAKLAEEGDVDAVAVNDILFEIEAKIVRSQILNGEPRIDGRDTRTVRPIEIRNGVLPRTHGSALFTRGETQALVVATLGTARDEQIIDALEGEYRDRFMFHYNMPPFATGETGRVGSPKRREIGHGRLAKRALIPVLPSAEDFAYSIRVVSEITESNGSSSMASVCGGCLAMMDAGVPVKAHVAGVAMGLILDGNRFAVLTDILGDEDHLGDMDFKVTGTENGITACQMDIKVQGLSYEVLAEALTQAKEGRLHILNEMKKAMPAVREDFKPQTPRATVIKIMKDQIGSVIGPGGKVVQDIQKQSGATVTIEEKEDGGYVSIFSSNGDAMAKAVSMVRGIVTLPEVGEVYEGKVKNIQAFGAFVEFLPGKDGLLHISEISWDRIDTMDGVFKEGDKIKVKLVEVDKKTGKFRLSAKVLLPKPEKPEAPAASAE